MHPFEVCSLMSCEKYIQPSNSHHNQHIEHLQHCKKFLHAPPRSVPNPRPYLSPTRFPSWWLKFCPFYNFR